MTHLLQRRNGAGALYLLTAGALTLCAGCSRGDVEAGSGAGPGSVRRLDMAPASAAGEQGIHSVERLEVP
ncbi:MAG TPA: hypothetical protein QF764_03000, partial [Planctomycetota bacterium]|nr:hypothetical protein [Planctomycetota bacterium]